MYKYSIVSRSGGCSACDRFRLRVSKFILFLSKISSGTANGRRPSVPCYVVILTDGLATDGQEYVTQARLMQWRGVRMMGVGIGSSVSHTDLITLSSNIDDVFSPDNDDMLNTILRETSHQDCNGKAR